MCKCFIKAPLMLCLAVFLFSCSSANNKPVIIAFSPDSSAVVFSGIDPAGLLQVRNTPRIDTAYAAVLSVLQSPSDRDTDSMELPVGGRVQVTDSTVVFIPVKPFVKGQRYLVVSYMNVKFGTPAMIFSGKLGQNVKPEQVILQR